MQAFRKEEILDVYRHHPQQAKRILERLCARMSAKHDLTECDLAHDTNRGITDQNHIGGVRFVRQLAKRAGVDTHHRILDLGSGLGGSARVLAHLYRCRVHGIDFCEERCAEARNLTHLVSLEGRVSFQSGDFMTMGVERSYYDLIWGQGAWSHVGDKSRFIKRWSAALKTGGRLAFEDLYLKHPPEDPTTLEQLKDLEDAWKVYIVPLGEWQQAVSAAYTLELIEDLTEVFVKSFSYMNTAVQDGDSTRIRHSEAQMWAQAQALGERGVIGYMRMIAIKKPEDNR